MPGTPPRAIRQGLGHALWRALRGLLLAIAAAVLFVEEWGWRPLAAALARLGRWPPLQRLERRIAGVSPGWALAFFGLPALLLFPVKLLALWLIQRGQAALGIAVIAVAKLFGTALLGRLFLLTEAQLTTFGWFARALGWWRTTRARVAAAVRASPLARALRAAKRRWRAWARRLAR